MYSTRARVSSELYGSLSSISPLLFIFFPHLHTNLLVVTSYLLCSEILGWICYLATFLYHYTLYIKLFPIIMLVVSYTALYLALRLCSHLIVISLRLPQSHIAVDILFMHVSSCLIKLGLLAAICNIFSSNLLFSSQYKLHFQNINWNHFSYCLLWTYKLLNFVGFWIVYLSSFLPFHCCYAFNWP